MALLAILAALLVAAIGALWLWLSPGSDGGSPTAIDGRTPPGASVSSGPGELPVPPAGGGSQGLADAATSTFDATTDPRRFDGRGSIRGQVVTDLGIELPERYAVVVGPSRSLVGRERAASRRVEYVRGEEEFRIEDLPLGGYDVWIEGERMTSRRTPVLLSRTAAHPYVILKTFPTGFIDGYVIRSDGSPAAEVKVTIQRVTGKDRREASTRADGLYRFDDLQDGEYSILFGPPETPLVPARSLVFTAPSMRFPDVTLPTTVNIRIFTRDHARRTIPASVITGFGDHGGKIDAVSDGSGEAWVENLPPGRYRVTARADDGRQARTTLEIKDEAGQEFWLVLR